MTSCGTGSTTWTSRSSSQTWTLYYPDELPPDADLTWEHIVRVTGETDAISSGLDALMAYVGETPSGDDDTFDYWPSGCRFALDLAAQCGRYEETRETIVRVITLHLPADLRDELLDKTRVNIAV